MIVAVSLIAGAAFGFALGLVVAFSGQDRKRKLINEIKRLRFVLFGVGDVVSHYRNGVTDIVGSQALSEIDVLVNDYWKDSKV